MIGHIQAKNILKIIKGKYILNNVSIQLERGKCYGLVGSSKSGKTMFLRALCGLMKVDKGEVVVDGKRIGYDIDFIGETGLLIGSPPFLEKLSGFENLYALANIRGTSEGKTKEALAIVGLLDERDKKVQEYSKDMKQRLRIAQAILEKPSILILDDPFCDLNKESIIYIEKVLFLYKKRGSTIFITGRDRSVIEPLCHKVFEMKNGKIVG